MVRLVRIQLVGFYFRLCAMEEKNDERASKWAAEMQTRFEEQKAKIISCMPPFVQKLKPDFETPAMAMEHWWRFINEAKRDQCLAIVESTPWYSLIGLPKCIQDKYALTKSNGTHPTPVHEWRFERPLLVDREPQPQTSFEQYPNAGASAEEMQERNVAFERDFTFLLCRFTHKRLGSFNELKALWDREWDPSRIGFYGGEYGWKDNMVRWKVVPTKGKPLPTFKLLGVMPSSAKTWPEIDSFAHNPFERENNTEWYLEDQGTSQDDF